MKTQPRQHISNEYNTCTIITSPVYIGSKIRHCHKYDSTAFYQINIECTANYCILVTHICTMIRLLKHFISFFLLNKWSKHKFWTLISRSQEATLLYPGFCVVLFTWIVAAYLYTLPYALESIWGKLCVGSTLVAWFVFYRKTIITNN